VKQKYQPAALIDFLKAPEKHYAWIKDAELPPQR
jgi:hypothetical protein